MVRLRLFFLRIVFVIIYFKYILFNVDENFIVIIVIDILILKIDIEIRIIPSSQRLYDV